MILLLGSIFVFLLYRLIFVYFVYFFYSIHKTWAKPYAWERKEWFNLFSIISLMSTKTVYWNTYRRALEYEQKKGKKLRKCIRWNGCDTDAESIFFFIDIDNRLPLNILWTIFLTILLFGMDLLRFFIFYFKFRMKTGFLPDL